MRLCLWGEGGGGGTVGNHCPGVGVDITLFPGNVCVDRKKLVIWRVWNSEELGNRNKKNMHYMYTLHCKSFMSHCTFDEKS